MSKEKILWLRKAMQEWYDATGNPWYRDYIADLDYALSHYGESKPSKRIAA
jgi:hypothetical protein